MKRGSSEARKAAPTTTVDGQALLDEMEAVLRRFIYLPNQATYSVVAAWALYTHAYDVFDNAPRLLLWSPVPGNGKSTLLRILKGLVRKGDLELNPTEAALFRNIEANHPTLLLDEADKYVHGYNSGIISILNSGHMKGMTVPRNVGSKGVYKLQHFNVFGPVAFAMKGRKPPADLLERSITIELQKAPATVELARFKSAAHDAELNILHQRAETWAIQNVEQTQMLDPKIPPMLQNRIADNWRPLFTVGQIAGGEWLSKLRSAAMSLEAQRGPGDSGLVLLGHVQQVFISRRTPWLSSLELCLALNENEEWPWGRDIELTPHRLADMLRPFGIKPEKRRVDGSAQYRGYSLQQFQKVWEQYGIDNGALGTLLGERLPKADNPIARALIQVTS